MNEDLLSLFPELEDFPTENSDSFSDSISFGRTIESVDNTLSQNIENPINNAGAGSSYYIPTDINGDGIADIYSIGTDINNDGIIDVVQGMSDLNHDGFCDTEFRMLDLDSNGIADIILQDTALDYNGDGIADSHIYVEDVNADRIADYAQQISSSDYNGDGIKDSHIYIEDVNADGVADYVQQDFASDYDGDGKIDSYDSYYDIDGNGIPDIIRQNTAIDYNNDTITDAYIQKTIDTHEPNNAYVSIYADYDGDHIWQAEQSFFIDNGSVYAIPDFGAGKSDAYQTFDPETADMNCIIGNPENYIDNWHAQETDFSCAVAAQEFAIEELLGIEFEEAELRRISVENGWLTDQGTSFDDIGKLMELVGLNVERSYGNTFEDLCDSLNRGIHPVVVVDPIELWEGINEELYMPGDDSSHAIQVIGVDMSDPENPMVILNDSGVSNGSGAMISKDIFVDAWEDFGCFMTEAYL